MPGKALHGISILYSNIILYLPATSKWLYLYTKLISSNTSKIVKSHARFIPHYSSLFSVANRHKTKHSQNGVMSCHMLSTQGKEAAFARFSLNSAKKHQKTHRSHVLHVSISRVCLFLIPPILQPFIVKISVFNWWYIHVASEPRSSFFHYLLVAFLSARRGLFGDTRILKQYEWIHMKEETILNILNHDIIHIHTLQQCIWLYIIINLLP